jgi:hypothetical protein
MSDDDRGDKLQAAIKRLRRTMPGDEKAQAVQKLIDAGWTEPRAGQAARCETASGLEGARPAGCMELEASFALFGARHP